MYIMVPQGKSSLSGRIQSVVNLYLSRTFTFWRFMLEIPLSSHEMKISYTINNGFELNFFVPGRNQNMRWAAYSVSHSSSCTRLCQLTWENYTV